MTALPFLDRLALPVVAAPMLRVSGIELVSAACRAGIVGAFPTANCASLGELDGWLDRLRREAREAAERGEPVHGPFCPNLIMRRDPAKLRDEFALIASYQPQVAITSVGSPAAAIPVLHAAGCRVLADVATLHHARRALDAGADGLVLLTAGAGGHTGWANPFAFVRAVRAFFDGPIMLSGGISDGAGVAAARVLGCDLVGMGTRFIGARESLASDGYKAMLRASTLDDIRTTRAFTGLPANFLVPSIRQTGLDPDALDESVTVQQARERFGGGADGVVIRRWQDLWSAGHSVSGVTQIEPAALIVERLTAQYRQARASRH
ncbi:nitronate monooxygenase family protein [Cupriavidus sp. AU9028]|uniref:NAD(P)H-dependent flavin oxidoreductase n=1 Tax=Cupriavidus sp. AU9028 TaxID=2871157 RepID=UPI001C9418A8|nr:nitronate monooxygenase [Cupriavidus sp. AU9028]MBY4898480.1 nitronate monooxygenase [Cupriavidus sp. AU9028]